MKTRMPLTRRAGIVAVILTLATAATMLPTQAAHAARLFRGGQQVIAETDTIHDDVYVSGGNLTVRGVIDGDVVAAGGRVGINGDVRGSVLAAGGDVQIYGVVTGSVRAAGGKITVGAQIGHDLVAAGGKIELLSEARVGRDALLGGGRVELNGAIARDAKIGTEELVLQPQSSIGGDLAYASDRSMLKTSGAVVNGRTTWYASGWKKHHRSPVERWFARLWGVGRFTVGILILGLLFVLLFPAAAERALERLATQPLPSTGVGVLTFMVMPFVAACLMVIGFVFGGWYVGGFLFALWMIAMSLGVVIAAITLGRWLGAALGARGLALVWALLLGAFLLMIVRVVPLAGQVVTFIAMLGGLGALASIVSGAMSAARVKRAA